MLPHPMSPIPESPCASRATKPNAGKAAAVTASDSAADRGEGQRPISSASTPARQSSLRLRDLSRRGSNSSGVQVVAPVRVSRKADPHILLLHFAKSGLNRSGSRVEKRRVLLREGAVKGEGLSSPRAE